MLQRDLQLLRNAPFLSITCPFTLSIVHSLVHGDISLPVYILPLYWLSLLQSLRIHSVYLCLSGGTQ